MAPTPMEQVANISELMEMILLYATIPTLLRFQGVSKAYQHMIRKHPLLQPHLSFTESRLPGRSISQPKSIDFGRPNSLVIDYLYCMGLQIDYIEDKEPGRGNCYFDVYHAVDTLLETLIPLVFDMVQSNPSWSNMRVWQPNAEEVDSSVQLWRILDLDGTGPPAQFMTEGRDLCFGEVIRAMLQEVDTKRETLNKALRRLASFAD